MLVMAVMAYVGFYPACNVIYRYLAKIGGFPWRHLKVRAAPRFMPCCILAFLLQGQDGETSRQEAATRQTCKVR